MVDFLQPDGHLVLEIGPGGGVLTRELATAGARVVAVEIDVAWAAELCRRFAGEVEVYVGDATEIHWLQLPPDSLVTGNLPFNVSTALIERLLPHWQRIPRAAFLVQREVADRLLAGPGDAAYGALSVLTAARARVTRLGRVSRGSFRPPPKVDGAFVGLALEQPSLGEEQMVGFASTVRQAFSQRRKQLRNALAADWGRAEAMAVLDAAGDNLVVLLEVDIGIDPRCRAEELSLHQFYRLHDARRQGLQR